MKKRALTLLLALAMIVSLAACGGGGSGAAGSYKMTKMNAAGVEMNIEDLAAMAGVDMTVTLELKSDGNFTLDMSALGTGSNVSGTWTASGSRVPHRCGILPAGDSLPTGPHIDTGRKT